VPERVTPMGDRPKKVIDPHVRAARENWLNANRDKLRKMGLPLEVYLSWDHWYDFLENGWLESHPEERTGYTFDRWSPGQMKQVLAFLEAAFPNPDLEYDAGNPRGLPSMVGWLRVRLGIAPREE
jgi:hypothetical protein